MNEETGFTEAQQQAIQKIEDLMREHFTSGILVVEDRDVEDDEKTGREFVWHGGVSTALGLAHMLDAKIKQIATED